MCMCIYFCVFTLLPLHSPPLPPFTPLLWRTQVSHDSKYRTFTVADTDTLGNPEPHSGFGEEGAGEVKEERGEEKGEKEVGLGLQSSPAPPDIYSREVR